MISTVPFGWFHGEAVEVEHGGVQGIAIPEPVAITKLPYEFFNRELQDAARSILACGDVGDLARYLCGFAGEWGIPYSPLRYMPACDLEAVGLASHEAAVDVSDDLRAALRLDECASVMEVYEAVKCLALVSASYVNMHGLDANGLEGFDPLAVAVVNECVRPPVLLAVDGMTLATAGHMPSLTNAVCNQIVEHEQDPAPWRLCACEGCGRWFKRRRGNARYRLGDVDSRYCCARCNSRQEKRNQRKRKRERG